MDKVSIQGRYRRAGAYDMYRLLGLRGSKLPAEGMPERLIQGVRVYVKPSSSTPQNRRCKHRVMAICNCGQHVPVGRLHQHKCKMTPARLVGLAANILRDIREGTQGRDEMGQLDWSRTEELLAGAELQLERALDGLGVVTKYCDACKQHKPCSCDQVARNR